MMILGNILAGTLGLILAKNFTISILVVLENLEMECVGLAMRFNRSLECLDLRTIIRECIGPLTSRVYTEWSLDLYYLGSTTDVVGNCVPQQFFYCYQDIFIDIGTNNSASSRIKVFTHMRAWK